MPPMPPMRKMHRADPALATRMPGDGGLVWHTLSADRVLHEEEWTGGAVSAP